MPTEAFLMLSAGTAMLFAPTSPCPTLSAYAEPISQAGSDITSSISHDGFFSVISG